MRDTLSVAYGVAAVIVAICGLCLGIADPPAAAILLWIALGFAVVALLLYRKRPYDYYAQRARNRPRD